MGQDENHGMEWDGMGIEKEILVEVRISILEPRQ
jgi:hypothetical protein